MNWTWFTFFFAFALSFLFSFVHATDKISNALERIASALEIKDR